MGIDRLNIHQDDYKAGAWESYSLQELGNFVHLFSKRAKHRSNPEKLKKDLYDAKNYLTMMEENLKTQAEQSGISYDSL